MKTVSQVFDFVVCPPGSSEDHFMFGRFSALLYLEHDLKIKQKNKIENNQQWQVLSPLAGNKTNKTKQNKTKPDNKNYNGKQSAQTNEWNVFKNWKFDGLSFNLNSLRKRQNNLDGQDVFQWG